MEEGEIIKCDFLCYSLLSRINKNILQKYYVLQLFCRVLSSKMEHFFISMCIIVESMYPYLSIQMISEKFSLASQTQSLLIGPG